MNAKLKIEPLIESFLLQFLWSSLGYQEAGSFYSVKTSRSHYIHYRTVGG